VEDIYAKQKKRDFSSLNLNTKKKEKVGIAGHVSMLSKRRIYEIVTVLIYSFSNSTVQSCFKYSILSIFKASSGLCFNNLLVRRP
jgi:hypothetical protein